MVVDHARSAIYFFGFLIDALFLFGVCSIFVLKMEIFALICVFLSWFELMLWKYYLHIAVGGILYAVLNGT